MRRNGYRSIILLLSGTFLFSFIDPQPIPERSSSESLIQDEIARSADYLLSERAAAGQMIAIIPEVGYFIRQPDGSGSLRGELDDPLGLKIMSALERAGRESDLQKGSAPTSEYLVTNSLDSGEGSLRWAIEQSNAHAGPDVIYFSTPGMNGKTISPASSLPEITDSGTVIDATWNWSGSWPAGEPGITINGSAISEYSFGLRISGAENVTIKGLSVEFFDTCIWIGAGGHNTIGEGATSQGGGRMLIHNCTGPGVFIIASHDNRVIGSYIGTSDAGNLPESNGGDGITILGSQHNSIGGEGALEGNIIGASDYGIRIIGSDSISNTVAMNQIGVGMLDGDIANDHDGVSIGGGATFNAVGGQILDIPGAGTSFTCLPNGNEIRNNWGSGVVITDLGSTLNGIMSNDLDDNQVFGIEVTNKAWNNIVGCNTVVRNHQSGIFVHQLDTGGGWIIKNYIGTDAENTPGMYNGHHGVGLYDGAINNLLDRNIIGTNGWSGVAIIGGDTSSNWLLKNWIGVSNEGESIGNGFFGVVIGSGSNNTLTSNDIANNGMVGGSSGVRIGEETAVGNALYGNKITNNAGDGIELTNHSQHDINPPAITNAQCPVVSGTAWPPGGRVDIFSDSSNEGQYFEGSVTVEAGGDWHYFGNFHGPNLTATVTNIETKDTSEFSASINGIGACKIVLLPMMLR